MFVALYNYVIELWLIRLVADFWTRRLGLGPRADPAGFVIERNWFVFPYICLPLRVVMIMMVHAH